jgi:tetratricopeptide (TPR) repeat protein
MPNTQVGRLTILLLLIFLGTWTAVAQDTEPTYDEQLASAKDLLHKYRYDEALRGLKRANELRGKQSAECYALMSDAYFGLEAYKNVIASADKTIALAGSDTQLLIRAYNNKGLALQAQADKKDQKKLEAAEAAFREGLKLQNAPPILRYNLGVVLMQQNRDPEGVAEMKQYMKLNPKGGYFETARKLVENPRRARENYAPDFSFTSADGEYITLEDLKGKVVMLDHDDAVWRSFTNKNHMIWPQYRDRDHRIAEMFSIRAFPTYIIIDHEGILRFQSTGYGSANLDAAIKRQLKAARSVELK